MTYSPNLGRWLQVDPLSFEAGDTNLYRTEGDNPANLTDPSGLDSSGDAKHPPKSGEPGVAKPSTNPPADIGLPKPMPPAPWWMRLIPNKGERRRGILNVIEDNFPATLKPVPPVDKPMPPAPADDKLAMSQMGDAKDPPKGGEPGVAKPSTYPPDDVGLIKPHYTLKDGRWARWRRYLFWLGPTHMDTWTIKTGSPNQGDFKPKPEP